MTKSGKSPKKAARKTAAKTTAKAKSGAETKVKAKAKAGAKNGAKSTAAKISHASSKPAKAPRASSGTKRGKLYYRIGEVAKLTGVKPHVLRYWETEFRWMAPPKSRSKQRLYRQKDIEMVKAIKHLLYEERYTMAGARLQLRELGIANVPQSNEEVEAEAAAARSPSQPDLDAIRAQYKQIRSSLTEIRDLL